MRSLWLHPVDLKRQPGANKARRLQVVLVRTLSGGTSGVKEKKAGAGRERAGGRRQVARGRLLAHAR